MTPLYVVPVAAIGTRTTGAFVNRGEDRPGGYEQIVLHVYPPSPDGERMRALRVDLDLGLREASNALGIKPVDLSALERGSARCDWQEMELRLRATRAITERNER